MNESTWKFRQYCSCLLLFLIVALPLLQYVVSQGAPHPLYGVASKAEPKEGNPEFPLMILQFGGKARFSVDLRGTPHAVSMPVVIRDKEASVHLALSVDGKPIGEGVVKAPEEFIRIDFDKPFPKGKRLEAEVWNETPLGTVPSAIFRGGTNSVLPIRSEGFHEATTPGGSPLLTLHYEKSGGRLGLALWGIAVVGWLFLRRFVGRAGADVWLVAGLGVGAALISVYFWQYRYSFHFGHYDPDGYLRYGQAIAGILQGDGAAHVKFLNEYIHFRLPLTPILVGGLIAMGVSPALAYVCLVSVAAMGSLLVVHWIAHHVCRHPLWITMLAMLTLLCHYRFLLSFAKPSPDMVGLFLVCVLVGVLMDRCRRTVRWHLPVLIVAAILVALARPQGVTYLPLVGLLGFVADWIRGGKKEWKGGLVNYGIYGVIVLLVYGGIYYAFDFHESLVKSLENNAIIAKWESGTNFMIGSTLKALQLAPFFLLMVFLKKSDRLLYLVPLLWVCFHLLLFPALGAGVQNTRLFLPVIPVVALGLAGWVSTLRGSKWPIVVVAVLLLAINLPLATWMMFVKDIPTILQDQWLK